MRLGTRSWGPQALADDSRNRSRLSKTAEIWQTFHVWGLVRPLGWHIKIPHLSTKGCMLILYYQ